MKDSVTRFNFDDAFKALDEIEIPVAEKGIRANRVDLKESMKRVDKFELLFEDFYDVNNADDMNTVSEEREAEVAKAKLARIEKIVDLDAETEDDILPSYVGKTIIQCPQCMTLFYKNAEDIVRDEENPDVVNVAEVCQHCGNESGYDVVGKVAEETEAAPGDELGTDDFSAEVGDGENDIAIDDGSETTEEAPVEEEGGEVDELSAEADLDSLDLDAELDFEEEPVEEEEEANESLNTSKLLKKIEDKNELKTEHESEKLTLNEDIEDNLDDKLKAHEEYIKELRDTIGELEKKLAGTKNEQIKTSIQSRIDAARAELEAALPEAVKAEAETEELPDATEAGMEDATDNTSEETEAAKDETEETTESLHEAVESMTDTLTRAWEVAKKTNSPIGVTVITPVGAGTNGKIKDWSHNVNANLYYVNAKNPDLMVTGFDEKMISRPDTIIVIDEFNRAPADAQKAISDEIDNLDTQVEMVIVISNDSNINGDNFKRFKQYVAVVEKETATESLNEAVKIADNEKYWVDYRPAFEAVAKEVDGKFDFAVNFNVYNEKIVVETKAAIQKEDLSKLLDAMTNSKVCKENNWKAVYTGLEDNKENMIKIQFEAAKSQTAKNEGLAEDVSMTSSPENFKTLLGTKEFKKPISQEEVESYFENFTQASEEKEDEELSDEADIEISVEGDAEPVSLETADSEKEPLTEGPISWGKKIVKGIKDKLDDTATKIATVAKAYQYKNFYILPYADTTQVARFFQDTGKYDTSRSYKKHSRSFLVTGNGAHDFPELRFTIDLSKDIADIAKAIKDKVIATRDLIKSLNNTYATTFVDLVGSAKNVIGEEYDTSDAKQKINLAYVDVVGVRTTLPDSAPNMSSKNAKTLMGQNPKLAAWLMKAENGNIVINEEFLKSAVDKLNNNTNADDVFADESFTKNLEQKLAKVKRIAYVSSKEDKQTVEQIVESKADENIANYKKLRDAGIEASESGDNYYTIGLTDDAELAAIKEGDELSLAANQFKALIIEKFEDGTATMNRSFTGKLPEAEKPTDKADGDGTPVTGGKKEGEGDDSDGTPVTGDDEVGDKDKKEVAGIIDESEPKTEGDRARFLSEIKRHKKAFLPIRIAADKKTIMPLIAKPFTKNATFEEWLRVKLADYNTILGAPIDTAIILVDNTSTFETKIQKIPSGISNIDESILVFRSKDGKLSTRLNAAIQDLTRVVASFNISDIDENSFNSQLTESLKEVYENVRDFTMTDCSLDNNKLIIEGTIAFNSGKTRSTQYIFEAKYNSKNVLILHGQNKALFEDGTIKISTKNISETLYAKALKYKYSVQGNLVEGLIKK